MLFGNKGTNVLINAGAGNDSINNTEIASNDTINTGAGDDTIFNMGANASINLGFGNDSIFNTVSGSLVTIIASDDDTVKSTGALVSIEGGGNDRISLSSDSKNNLIDYNVGDGNDTIWGYSANTTLNIAGAKYSI